VLSIVFFYYALEKVIQKLNSEISAAVFATKPLQVLKTIVASKGVRLIGIEY
jgi:hypothetical protein